MKRKIVTDTVLQALQSTSCMAPHDLQRAIEIGIAAKVSDEFLAAVSQSFLSYHYNAAVEFVRKYVGNFPNTVFGRDGVYYFLQYHDGDGGVEIRISAKNLQWLRLHGNVDGLWLRGKVGEQNV